MSDSPTFNLPRNSDNDLTNQVQSMDCNKDPPCSLRIVIYILCSLGIKICHVV